MIIGLTGYAQSGKDTVAQILVEDYGFKKVAFADKIRELLYEMDPMVKGEYHLKVLVDAYGWDIVKQTPEVRRMLQNLGVSARKTFNEDFWVQQALRPVHFTENWVITDVRFENEARIIKKYDNAQIWRIKRPGVEAVNTHVSELELEHYKVDQILKNEGTLEDLKEKIKTRMELSPNAN